MTEAETIKSRKKQYLPQLATIFSTILRSHRKEHRKNCGTTSGLEHFERNLTLAIRDATSLLTNVDASCVSHRRGDNTWASIELGFDDNTVLSFLIVEAENGRATNGLKP